MNFWEKLKKPIFILAPMYGVTDSVFRQIVCSVGLPDVLFTEFVPVDAILSKNGKEVIEKSLQFSEIERPIVAQIWGADPEKFYQVAKILFKMGFDGIDINMGCPDESTIKKGACSALIKNPKLAQGIISETIKGANGLPVSVKTRIGFKEIETECWVKSLLETPIVALILHLRTASEMSKVPAHWEEIKKVVKVKKELNSKTLIIGNGDINSLEDAEEKCKEYGIDGVMIGRGIFENIWIFNSAVSPEKISPKQKIELLLKHLDLYKRTYNDTRHFELMKKFVKCYVNNFEGSAKVRDILMNSKSLDGLIKAVRDLRIGNSHLT